MADDDLLAAEAELEEQLRQHAEALQGVRDALRADGGNAQLVEAEGELAAAAADIEATLLELKRERLLADVGGGGGGDTDADGGDGGGDVDGGVTDGSGPAASQQTAAGETARAAADGGTHTVVRIGGRYRFRFTDGHWHAGLVVALQHLTSLTGAEAVVRFLHPVERSQLGGVQLPASALQPDHARPHDMTRLAPGATAFARLAAAIAHGSLPSTGSPPAPATAQQPDDAAAQLWEEVRIVAFRHGGHAATVAAAADPGRSADVAVDDLILTPWADDDDDDDAYGSDSDEEEGLGARQTLHDGAPPGGLREGSGGNGPSADLSFQPAAPGDIPHDGDAQLDPMRLAEAEGARADAAQAVMAAAAAARQTDTATFAEWEASERGIGSRIMAALGYVAGRGLGRGGAGIVAPIQVTALRPGAGLGVLPNNTAEGAAAAKKRRRGGKKARARKFAEAQRAHREAHRDEGAAADLAGEAPGLFGFINSSLGDGSEAAAARRGGGGGSGGSGGRDGVQKPSRFGAKAPPRPTADSRRQLAEAHLRTDKLRNTVAHLERMATRQAGDAVMAPQVARKLAAARAALAAADGAHGSALASIQQTEKQKRWAKF